MTSTLNDKLQASFDHAWERWSADHPEMADSIRAKPDLWGKVVRVWGCSEFVQEQCQRQAQLLPELVDRQDGAWGEPQITLEEQLVSITDEAGLMRQLRWYRNRQMAAIAWDELLGCDYQQTLQALSALADDCVQQALQWLTKDLEPTFGVPRNAQGDAQPLVVLAMGKLGACELNYSSDIDLIFCYPESGETDGRRKLSNEEFFLRLCRRLVKVLDQVTADGFVFRVDTRLRPHGESGPLALNTQAMENYYLSQAREWERYAMVKVRPITGDVVAQEAVMELLRSFVYRRYLDFGVFESIRTLKRQIERELQRKDRQQNVKLGPGGIREIEFIGQAFQLIRGGRDVDLQHRSIVYILGLLGERGHIPKETAQELIDDYAFLRRLENRLQAIGDQQLHDLPAAEIPRQRLLLAMQRDGWGNLVENIEGVMARVHEHFQTLVVLPEAEANDTGMTVHWQHADLQEFSAYLEHLGYQDAERLGRSLVSFFQSYPVRSLQHKGRDYLERLMPLLTSQVAKVQEPETILLQFLHMLEQVASRVSYLVLLVETPGVLKQLIQLAAASPWILSQIARSPILLDELIDPRSLYAPKSKSELESELGFALANIEQDDLERLMEELRLFKKTQVLRVAASDITGSVPLMVVSDALTEIAEVLLEQALQIAWRNMGQKYGVPVGASLDQVSGFCLIAFGKMGGIELGFGSDLDLVFLHQEIPVDEYTTGEKPILSSLFYARLAKRLIHILNAHTFSGPLYEIDLRLRPNGNSGLLVTSVEAFQAYQEKQAWTWEHQSLVRARPVAGDNEVAAAFKVVREQILSQSRDLAALQQDVLEMREKMRQNLIAPGETGFNLKQSPGGIVDIEFIVQFAILALAHQHSELVRYTDNIRLIEGLNGVGYFTDQQAADLAEAYKTFRKHSHQSALAEQAAVVDQALYQQQIDKVTTIWQEKVVQCLQ